MKELIPHPEPPGGEFLFYQTEDGRIRLQVRVQDETVWLSQKLMAELFQKDVRTINEHIQNIFDERELSPGSVIRKFRITAAAGKGYETAHYNLDVIISVGYRVKSQRGTQFRIWATQRLREYIVKGFTMDDERLKQRGGGNYFEELFLLFLKMSDEVRVDAAISLQLARSHERGYGVGVNAGVSRGWRALGGGCRGKCARTDVRGYGVGMVAAKRRA